MTQKVQETTDMVYGSSSLAQPVSVSLAREAPRLALSLLRGSLVLKPFPAAS